MLVDTSAIFTHKCKYNTATRKMLKYDHDSSGMFYGKKVASPPEPRVRKLCPDQRKGDKDELIVHPLCMLKHESATLLRPFQLIALFCMCIGSQLMCIQ